MDRTAFDLSPFQAELTAWSIAFLIFASINAGIWVLS